MVRSTWPLREWYTLENFPSKSASVNGDSKLNFYNLSVETILRQTIRTYRKVQLDEYFQTEKIYGITLHRAIELFSISLLASLPYHSNIPPALLSAARTDLSCWPTFLRIVSRTSRSRVPTLVDCRACIRRIFPPREAIDHGRAFSSTYTYVYVCTYLEPPSVLSTTI